MNSDGTRMGRSYTPRQHNSAESSRPLRSAADLHGLTHPDVRVRRGDQEIRHIRPGD